MIKVHHRAIDAMFYDIHDDNITNGDTPVAISNVTIADLQRQIVEKLHDLAPKEAVNKLYVDSLTLTGGSHVVKLIPPKPITPATKPADPAFANVLRPRRRRMGLRYLGVLKKWGASEPPTACTGDD